MCNQAVGNNPNMLRHVPDHRKTQKMCDKSIEIEQFLLGCVLDCYKTQKMLKKATEKDSSKLRYVPNDPG